MIMWYSSMIKLQFVCEEEQLSIMCLDSWSCIHILFIILIIVTLIYFIYALIIVVFSGNIQN